jgi:hypothetical protein
MLEHGLMAPVTTTCGWQADSVSKKGPTKPRVQAIDCPGRIPRLEADRKGLLFWTLGAITGFRMHPEQTPLVPMDLISDRLQTTSH